MPHWLAERVVDYFSRATPSASERAQPLFVVEGVDGAGKTSLVDALANSRQRQCRSSLRVVRLRDYHHFPPLFQPVYLNHIKSVVHSAASFPQGAAYLASIAEMDAMLYKMQISSIRSAYPDAQLISDSWAHKRLAKMLCLAVMKGSEDSKVLAESILTSYGPVIGTSHGALVEVAATLADKRKRGNYTPWEVVSVTADAELSDSDRFIQLATATGFLLSKIADVLGWVKISTDECDQGPTIEQVNLLADGVARCGY